MQCNIASRIMQCCSAILSFSITRVLSLPSPWSLINWSPDLLFLLTLLTLYYCERCFRIPILLFHSSIPFHWFQIPIKDGTIHVLGISIYHLFCITIQRYIAWWFIIDGCFQFVFFRWQINSLYGSLNLNNFSFPTLEHFILSVVLGVENPSINFRACPRAYHHWLEKFSCKSTNENLSYNSLFNTRRDTRCFRISSDQFESSICQ